MGGKKTAPRLRALPGAKAIDGRDCFAPASWRGQLPDSRVGQLFDVRGINAERLNLLDGDNLRGQASFAHGCRGASARPVWPRRGHRERCRIPVAFHAQNARSLGVCVYAVWVASVALTRAQCPPQLMPSRLLQRQSAPGYNQTAGWTPCWLCPATQAPAGVGAALRSCRHRLPGPEFCQPREKAQQPALQYHSWAIPQTVNCSRAKLARCRAATANGSDIELSTEGTTKTAQARPLGCTPPRPQCSNRTEERSWLQAGARLSPSLEQRGAGTDEASRAPCRSSCGTRARALSGRRAQMTTLSW